jgi:hypothetical protein
MLVRPFSMKYSSTHQKTNIRHVYRWMMFLTALLLASANSVAAQTSVVNILTVDKKQAGFGDLVSNWYTALVLKKRNPNLTINFYLSQPFRERFKKIEPTFEENRPTTEMPQDINGIWIYSIGADVYPPLKDLPPKKFKAREEAFENQIKTWVPKWLDMDDKKETKHVCTLAFTAPLEEIIRDKNNLGPQTTERAAGYFVLEAMRDKLKSFKGERGQSTKIAPLLAFNYFLYVGHIRYPKNGEGSFSWFKESKHGGVPIYGLPASFLNGAMFLSKQNDILGIQPYSANVDHLGYAYAHHPDSVKRYLTLVRQFARDHPDEKILVIVPSQKAEVLFGNSDQFKKIRVSSKITWRRFNQRRGLQFTPISRSNHAFYQYKNPELKNLYLLHIPGGISFKDVAAIMKASNLPILVTGTLSLSQALQYDRAIIYEALPHHRGAASLPGGGKSSFANEIEQSLSRYLRDLENLRITRMKMLQSSRRGKGPPLKVPNKFSDHYKVIFPSEKLPLPNETETAQKTHLNNEIQNINDRLFAVPGSQNGAPTEPNGKRFYKSFKKENREKIEWVTGKYRTRLDGGFLFDRVLDYCEKAREHFREIREWENTGKKYSKEVKEYFSCRFQENIAGRRQTPECVGIKRPK